MRRLVAAVVLAAALAGCGSDVSLKEAGDRCYQQRERSFLGWHYSRSQNVVSCGS